MNLGGEERENKLRKRVKERLSGREKEEQPKGERKGIEVKMGL